MLILNADQYLLVDKKIFIRDVADNNLLTTKALDDNIITLETGSSSALC